MRSESAMTGLRTDKEGCVGCRRLMEQLADVERIRAAEQAQAQELHDRLQTVVDEQVGPHPVSTADELLTVLERHVGDKTQIAEALMAKYEWLKDLWAEESPPQVPDGYTVIQLDGRWRLVGQGCTESDPPQLLEQDGDGVAYSDDYGEGPVDAAAALALCWAILHDREPRHAGRTVL